MLKYERHGIIVEQAQVESRLRYAVIELLDHGYSTVEVQELVTQAIEDSDQGS